MLNLMETAAIDSLNPLIVINNDRIEGYKTAAHENKEAFLKDLFGELAATKTPLQG